VQTAISITRWLSAMTRETAVELRTAMVEPSRYWGAPPAVIFLSVGTDGHVGRIESDRSGNRESAWEWADPLVKAGVLRSINHGPATYGHVSYWVVA